MVGVRAKNQKRAGPTPSTIGSGTGDLALALLRAGAAQVVAADFSEVMLLPRSSPFSPVPCPLCGPPRRRRPTPAISRRNVRPRQQRPLAPQRRRPAGRLHPSPAALERGRGLPPEDQFSYGTVILSNSYVTRLP